MDTEHARAAVTQPARGPGRTDTAWTLGLAVLVGVIAATLAWARLPASARDTLWAEDSALFLQQRVEAGPLATVFRPYDGYLHLVPRLMTDLATALPVEDYARTVTALSCLVVGIVAALTVWFVAPIARHPMTRAAFALVPALTPVVAFEVLGNSANVHSFLLYLVPVLLLVRPRTWRASVFPAVVAVVIGLSEIQALFFVPLLVLMVRRRRAWPIGFGLVAALAVQLLVNLTSGRVRTPVDQRLSDVVRGWFLEPVTSSFWPRASTAADHIAAHGWPLVLALTVPFLFAAVLVLVGRWRRGDGLGPLRALALALLVGSPVVWGADLVLNPTPFIAFGEHGPTFIGQVGYLRYAAVPSMFLFGLLVLAAERVARVPRAGARTVAVVGALAVLCFAAWRSEPYDVARSGAPTWTTEYLQAEQHCTGGVAGDRLDQAPRSWGVELSCDTIRSDDFP
ncbi:hypothetical protein [Curtobacterium citreum]|uniref:hypothetical protein n=1 Tax=Curtobacterium citreum TaxID=2036 RepID=UPI0025431BEA|nr:hypothetical protein [Curtobacterium citreum]WIJ44212.1 hypothetical protein QPK07_10690 [Curtobacterium citreum]